jgi:hypothetical protein
MARRNERGAEIAAEFAGLKVDAMGARPFVQRCAQT